MAMVRQGSVVRKTQETEIKLELVLDGSGRAELDSGIPFLDHMLDSFCRHGLFDLKLQARGDLEVDFHHTVEDIGICFGLALKEALADKAGIRRFGWAVVPMDEALALVSLDLSGRPHLSYEVSLTGRQVGHLDAGVMREFFAGLTAAAAVTLHVRLLAGDDVHHSLEAVFKSFGKALDLAVGLDERVSGIPSAKGVL